MKKITFSYGFIHVYDGEMADFFIDYTITFDHLLYSGVILPQYDGFDIFKIDPPLEYSDNNFFVPQLANGDHRCWFKTASSARTAITKYLNKYGRN